MQAASTSTTAAAVGSNINVDSSAAPLRACSTSGCRVSKYVELTKRKCSQFVSAPYIMPKPLVVNGKTSIFQVGGEMAKMGDIPSLASATSCGDGQPIYRIKPGTHAHVINYVFIDEGSDSMEKAKSEDQEAMRMLLDSQRESATAKLQKLITTHRGVGQNASAFTPAPSTAATIVAAPSVAPTPNLTAIPTKSIKTPLATSSKAHVTTPQIHPDLSITSVAGALPRISAPGTAPVSTPSPAGNPAVAVPNRTNKRTSDTSVDELHAEIDKLKRTVSRLKGAAPR